MAIALLGANCRSTLLLMLRMKESRVKSRNMDFSRSGTTFVWMNIQPRIMVMNSIIASGMYADWYVSAMMAA
jgi:hypothetical protein